jgi:hypothetical protein
MLLIILLGLVAKLTSVSGGGDWDCRCDVATKEAKNFYFPKVCIIALSRFLKSSAVKTAACFYISFVDQ